MSYLLAFLAGLFGLNIISGLVWPRRHYDPNREFYDADTGDTAPSPVGGPASFKQRLTHFKISAGFDRLPIAGAINAPDCTLDTDSGLGIGRTDSRLGLGISRP